MREITYDDKSSLSTSPLPRTNKATADDFNEIKEVVNANANTTIVTTANTNLDDYKKTGVYYFNTNVTPSNIPAGVNGWLIVLKGNQDYVIKQIWLRHGTYNSNDFETYVRTKMTISGVTDWASWQRLIVENDSFYKDGDSFTFTWSGGACLTSGATEIQFSISLPKRIKSTIKPTITAGQLRIRRPSGRLYS